MDVKDQPETLTSWKQAAAPGIVTFFENVKEMQKTEQDDPLWEKYGHRAGNLAQRLVGSAIMGDSVREQEQKMRDAMNEKVIEDPEFKPLLEKLLPVGYDWKIK